MRITHFALLSGLLLLLVIGRPGNRTPDPSTRQAEEAREEFEEEEIILPDELLYPVTFQSKSPREETIADIYWLKEAAKVALSYGTPYFNVVDQKITSRFDRSKNRNFSVINGVIELSNDPMSAQYDAHEIESLVLNDNVD